MPRKRQDLTGKRFGKLVVVEYSGLGSNSKQNFSEWVCQCDCGNTCVAAGYALQAGRKKSCGCIRVASENLTGQRFGKLTVLGEDREQTSTLRKVICKCDCGNTKSIAFRDLKKGKITSCGCDRVPAPQKKSYFELHYGNSLEQKRKLFVLGEYKEICTLYEWIYIWIYEVLPGMMKESTITAYKSILEKHVLPGLGEKKLADITSGDIREWLKRLRSEKVPGAVHDNLMESTVYNTLSVLNSCMRDAQKYRLIGKNPCLKYTREISSRNLYENPVCLDEDQLIRLEQVLFQYRSKEKYPLGIGFQLMLYAGLHLSEALALRWRDVNPARKSLYVQSFVSQIRGSKEPGRYQLEQNTGYRKREVPIPEFFLQRLMDIRAQFTAGEDAFVVNPYVKEPMSPECMRAALARKGVQAGCGRVTPQMLRDTYAMRAVKAGAASDVIAELMGFSSPQQVVKRYMPGRADSKWELVSWMYRQPVQEVERR